MTIASRQDVHLKEFFDASGAPAVGLGHWQNGATEVTVTGARKIGGAHVRKSDSWHIGSITKSMTSLLAARLVSQGLIGWDSTIGDVLGASVPIHEDFARARLDALLSHQAGLPANLGRFWTLRLMMIQDVQAGRQAYAKRVLRGPPQQDFLYSNAGYVVAGLMLSRVSGRPWEELMRSEVFAPLGLSSAGFGPPAHIEGHRIGRNGPIPIGQGFGSDNPAMLGPAGTVHMSLEDVLRYAGAHLKRDPHYLPPGLWDDLHRPRAESYAMGWHSEEGYIEHWGSNTFWLVAVAADPKRQRAAVVAANSGDLERLTPLFEEQLDRLL